jgi:hypothetical protein
MKAVEDQEKEFVIPTKYKSSISSRLSWPLGAAELTKQFAGVPQLRELRLSFSPRHGENQQAKLPAVFNIIEIRHHIPVLENDTSWVINNHAVPRNARAKIREAFVTQGFKNIVEWLIQHAKFSGSASTVGYNGFWHSDIDELKFDTHDYVLPEISTPKQKHK